MYNDAVSLPHLEKINHPKFNERSLRSSIRIVDRAKGTRGKSGRRYLFLVTSKEVYSDLGGHLVTVFFTRGITDLRTPSRDKVRLHCSCPAFVFWGPAYNSTHHEDPYNLDFTENRPPDVRDPLRKVKVCKHLVRAKKFMHGMSFKRLDKIVRNALEGPEDLIPIPITETYGCIAKFMERTYTPEYSKDFVLSLNEHNYEDKLLEVGAIV